MPVTITRPGAAEIDLDRLGECGAKAAFASCPDRLLERFEALALVGDGAERRKDGAGLLLNHGAAVYHWPAELENRPGVPLRATSRFSRLRQAPPVFRHRDHGAHFLDLGGVDPG